MNLRPAAAALLVLAAAAPAPDPPLRLAAAGPAPYLAALRTQVLAPFTKTRHQPVALVPAIGRPDVLQLDPLALARGCQDGTLRRLDWRALGGRARAPPNTATDCGAGAWLRVTVLTWDTARLPITPTWADFWNVARFPGRRGLRRSPIGTLEIALLADGVAPGDIYATLARPDGVDRAFRKLDQLRPYIVWWTQDSEPVAIVAAGRALMGSAPSDQVRTTSRRLRRSFGLQWRQSLASVQSWAIAAGSAQPDRAIALIGYASDPQRQAAILAQAGTEPATALPHAAPDTPAAADLGDAVPFDAGFWRDRLAPLQQRFDAWLRP